MSTLNALWFIEPLQILSTLGSAINFGGSVLQSPLIMPTLTDTIVNVPIHHTAHQTAYLLHNSEHFFPPLNALCTLSNVVLAGTAYYNRDVSPVLAARFSRFAVAAALNVATTAWALIVMVPMNKKMTVLATRLKNGVQGGQEKEDGHKVLEREFRDLQKRWRTLNYGRAFIMIAGAVVGATALVTNA